MSHAQPSRAGSTYYIKKPGAPPEGPLDRSAVWNRATPGTKVTSGKSWLPIEAHPEFSGWSNQSLPADRYPIPGKAGPGCWIALLGFLPGVPQMILGQIGKGLFILILSIPLSSTGVLYPLLVIIFAIDAAKLGQKLRRTGQIGSWEFMPS